jgi:hypothetical protein
MGRRTTLKLSLNFSVVVSLDDPQKTVVIIPFFDKLLAKSKQTAAITPVEEGGKAGDISCHLKIFFQLYTSHNL